MHALYSNAPGDFLGQRAAGTSRQDHHAPGKTRSHSSMGSKGISVCIHGVLQSAHVVLLHTREAHEQRGGDLTFVYLLRNSHVAQRAVSHVTVSFSPAWLVSPCNLAENQPPLKDERCQLERCWSRLQCTQ